MRRLALSLLLLPVLLAAPARAAGPEVGIADDRLLLAGGATAQSAVDRWAQLGVDDVRIYALWSRIEPTGGARDWAALDAAVDRVRAAGMTVTLSITGPGPLSSSRVPSRGDASYKPDPAKFAAFAREVAARYGDRVNRYILWNEPNLGRWLRPQADCTRRGCTPASPHIYRALVRAAYPAVKAADPGARVLIGAMSSRGSTLRSSTSTMRPLAFLRGLGCVTASYARDHGAACKGFKPATADGFAFHPHGVLTSPDTPFPNRDDVNIASLSARLEPALDRLQRSRSLIPTTRRFDLYLDEYGYQTNPPDRISGVSLAKQDAWLQRAAYRAWRDPRVKLLTQYLWQDEPIGPDSAFGAWQSGLIFQNGRAKPALAHWPTPFALDASAGRLWGQVRPGGASAVSVQRRLRGSSAWHTIARRTTDSRGYWSWTTRLSPGASYRYLAAGATSATVKR